VKGIGCHCCEITRTRLETPELPELDSSAALPGQLHSWQQNAVCSYSAGRSQGPSENTPDLLQTAPHPLPQQNLPL